MTIETQAAKIRSLYRYFRWTMLQKEHYDAMRNSMSTPSDEMLKHARLDVLFGIRSYWYASLFVVLEGWKELQLDDEEIGLLLANDDNINLLKRHRNGVFHYRANYFDNRLMNFLENYESAASWALTLHKAFAKFFRGWLESRGVTGEMVTEGNRITISVRVAKTGEPEG